MSEVKRPFLSVVVPVFNAEKYLRRCLNSILTQTFNDIEVIVINDGSTDTSSVILKDFATLDHRVRVISTTNQGVSAARNKGIEGAKADYVTFLDADDYYLDKNAFKRLYEVRRNAGLTMFNIKLEGKPSSISKTTGVYNEARLNSLICDAIKDESINSPCNKLYNRNTLAENDLRFNEEVKIGEDLLFNIQYLSYCNSVYYLDEDFYFYRRSAEGSATNRYMPNKYNDLMFVNKEMIKILSKKNDFRLIEIAMYIRIKNILSCMRSLYDTSLNWSDRLKKAEEFKQKNPSVIIRKLGLKLLLLSIIFNLSSSKILLPLSRVAWRYMK